MYPTTSDSGVSFDSNASTITSMSDDAMQPLQSTKINSDDTQSISKLSNYSYIPHDQHNISNFDVSAWHVVPTKFECCHCDCHVSATHASNKQSDKLQHLYYPVGAQTDTRSKNQVYPFIFWCKNKVFNGKSMFWISFPRLYSMRVIMLGRVCSATDIDEKQMYNISYRLFLLHVVLVLVAISFLSRV